MPQGIKHAAYLCENVLVSIVTIVHFEDAVHYWYVPPIHVEHHHLARSNRCRPHIEEKNVTTLESWLHTAAQNHDNL